VLVAIPNGVHAGHVAGLAGTRWNAILTTARSDVASSIDIVVMACHVDDVGFTRCHGRFRHCEGRACPGRRGKFLRRRLTAFGVPESVAFGLIRGRRYCWLVLNGDADPFTG
jgi:hypothetical protein